MVSSGVVCTPDGTAFVFWVGNQYRSKSGGWDLEVSGPDLTGGVLTRLLADR